MCNALPECLARGPISPQLERVRERGDYGNSALDVDFDHFCFLRRLMRGRADHIN